MIINFVQKQQIHPDYIRSCIITERYNVSTAYYHKCIYYLRGTDFVEGDKCQCVKEECQRQFTVVGQGEDNQKQHLASYTHRFPWFLS